MNNSWLPCVSKTYKLVGGDDFKERNVPSSPLLFPGSGTQGAHELNID